ncbi:hypothetical protein L2D01_13380 [Hyphomonadaceae bacterium ML37]|nr:hypothetical protein L2D01_13380 [Hyphomonadaceae bacterium ML37]
MPSWEEAPDWMRDATFEGVRFRLSHRDASPGAQHDQWMAQKARNGWRYGEVKDADARTHPMMVPFEDLQVHERRKDALFAAVVEALTRPI